MTWCFTALTRTWAIDSVLLSVQGFWPWGCRDIDGTPWTPDRVTKCALGLIVYCDFSIFDLMIWCGHVLIRLLMMQADDSLPSRLTYGVKGPHTSGQQSICGTTLARLIKNHQQDIFSVDLRDLWKGII